MRIAIFVLFVCGVATASEQTLATFDACWSLVKRHFYDPGLHGVDWDAMKSKYRPLADKAAPGDELHGLLTRMLMELKASHAAILPSEVYEGLVAELRNRRYWTFGMVLEEARPGALFLRTAFEGGPASEAGLLTGDRIVSIDGAPAPKSPHLIHAGYDPTPGSPRLFFLRARKDVRLRLGYQRRKDGPLKNVRVAARKTNAVDACRASVRVVKRGRYRIGTLHIWYCQGGVQRVLKKAIEGPLKDCDALVLDVRGRGGSSAITYAIARLCREWNKPLAVLIDKRTRSAKEVLALLVRKRGLGILVGEKTEGAVLGAGFFLLPDGSTMELPVADVVVLGVRLEGRGVRPHVLASVRLPYAAGFDALFEEGCLVAIREAARRAGHRVIANGCPGKPAFEDTDNGRMTEPRRSRPVEKRVRRRLEAEVIRFEVVRRPSGLYMHRTCKVIIPVPRSWHR